MKKLISVFSFCFSLLVVNAQVITKEELKEYTKENNESSVDKAKELSEKYKLDENGDLTITETIDCPGVTAKDLFYKVSEWMLTQSPQASSAMQTLGLCIAPSRTIQTYSPLFP
jgi:chromosome segregation and condensation protein ScpB